MSFAKVTTLLCSIFRLEGSPINSSKLGLPQGSDIIQLLRSPASFVIVKVNHWVNLAEKVRVWKGTNVMNQIWHCHGCIADESSATPSSVSAAACRSAITDMKDSPLEIFPLKCIAGLSPAHIGFQINSCPHPEALCSLHASRHQC